MYNLETVNLTSPEYPTAQEWELLMALWAGVWDYCDTVSLQLPLLFTLAANLPHTQTQSSFP